MMNKKRLKREPKMVNDSWENTRIPVSVSFIMIFASSTLHKYSFSIFFQPQIHANLHSIVQSQFDTIHHHYYYPD